LPETLPVTRITGRSAILTIGMPVFNGERYLPAALASLLNQTFSEFELLIQDNASTDRTREMCRSFAATDARISYQRNERNLGAAKNYNRVLDRASGRYFKWAAHDDVCKPDYLRRCIEVLEQQQDVVLCHSQSEAIDPAGKRLGIYADEPEAMDAHCWQRFARVILPPHYCIPVFGVMRRSVLEKTIRHGDWVGADRNLLAELALHGKMRLVDELLFQRRHHAESSISKFPDERMRAAWFKRAAEADTGGSELASRKKTRVYPTWRRLQEYRRAINRVPMSSRERIACRAVLMRWFCGRHHTGKLNAALLLKDLRPIPESC
jgi:glycosyltransferase involved in cell wall biosynthesis